MNLRSYVVVTAGYWAFTLTDGALRMLVLLYFHDLGYSPVSLAFLFLLYEVMGVATNLVGGWIGARTGLNRTLIIGLATQTVSLGLLTLHDPAWREWLSVGFVMGVQALSGVAKDFTKMSSKSAVKYVAGEGGLFSLVALLTGSKNALKGAGFFLGAVLLSWRGFDGALVAMAIVLAAVLAAVLLLLDSDIGRAKQKPTLRSILSKSSAINRLSAARLFLFAARDIWFVVALPVFLNEELGWSFEAVGGFLALWVIGYGAVQSVAPRLVPADRIGGARLWVLILLVSTTLMAAAISAGLPRAAVVITGLTTFGVVFAVNSSLHSYLVLAYAGDDAVSLDVGFYYSANAAGRLVGTMLSGLLYLAGGLEVALWGSATFVAVTWLLTRRLPPLPQSNSISTSLEM